MNKTPAETMRDIIESTNAPMQEEIAMSREVRQALFQKAHDIAPEIEAKSGEEMFHAIMDMSVLDYGYIDERNELWALIEKHGQDAVAKIAAEFLPY